MKLRRLHVSGPQAWPDKLLDVDTRPLGLVVAIGRWAAGAELALGWGNPWLSIYLGWWCFEAYLDREGGLEE